MVSTLPTSLDVKMYEYKDVCTEQNTTSMYKRIITYSTSPDFSTYKRLSVGIYLKGFLGGNRNMPVLMIPHPSLLDVTDWDYLIIGQHVFKQQLSR